MDYNFKDLYLRIKTGPLYGEEGLEYQRLHEEYVSKRSSLTKMLLDQNTHFFHYEELLRRSRVVVWIPCALIGFLFPYVFTGWRYWVSMAVPAFCIVATVFVISYLWIFMLFTYLGANISRLIKCQMGAKAK